MATLLHIGDRTDTSKAGISSMFDDVLAQWRQHPLTIHRRSLSINNGDPGEALHPTHLKQVLYWYGLAKVDLWPACHSAR